jgi:hypothetical protein
MSKGIMNFPETKDEFEVYKTNLEAKGFTVITKWRTGLKSIRLGDIVLSATPDQPKGDK